MKDPTDNENGIITDDSNDSNALKLTLLDIAPYPAGSPMHLQEISSSQVCITVDGSMVRSSRSDAMLSSLFILIDETLQVPI